MKSFGNTIYAFACIVAATVLGIVLLTIGSASTLTAFLSWAVLAAIPWPVGRASLLVLARR